MADYFRSEITTGISVESQPSGLYTESNSPVYQTQQTHALRSRTEVHARNEKYKRLSLVSSESAGTSGIYDMSSANEGDKVVNKADGGAIATSTPPSKPHNLNQHRNENRVLSSGTANALIDMPFRQVKFTNNEMEDSFVRNTVKRRTLHLEYLNEEFDGENRKHVGRSVSNPTSIAIAVDDKRRIFKPRALDELDETESDSCDDGSCFNRETEGESTSRRIQSVSVCSLPYSPPTPVSPMQASTPCLASPSPKSAALSSGKSTGDLKFTFTTKKKEEKSKDKGKDKQKRVMFFNH